MKKKLFILLFWGAFLIFMIDCSPNFKNGERQCEIKLVQTLDVDKDSLDCVTELSIGIDTGKEVPAKIFEFENLEYLGLYMPEIDSLPDEISKLENLEHLTISYSKLRYISKDIGKLQKLRDVGFMYDDLDSIPTEICQLKRLKVLNLHSNNIKKLPMCLCELDSVTIVLNNNPIDSLYAREFEKCNTKRGYDWIHVGKSE